MTDAEAVEAFFDAMVDPDPSSTEVAQDIALEHGFKLWKLGERQARLDLDPEEIARYASMGTFYFRDENNKWNGGEWKVQERGPKQYRVRWNYQYHGHQWEWLSAVGYPSREAARTDAVDELWWALDQMKKANAAGETLEHVKMRIFEKKPHTAVHGWASQMRGEAVESPLSFPAELNPARSEEDALQVFWAAINDPDPSSIQVAQDIALEQGWKLLELGEMNAQRINDPWTIEPSPYTISVGAFYYTSRGERSGVTWSVGWYERQVIGKVYRITLRYAYAQQEIAIRAGQLPMSTTWQPQPMTFENAKVALDRAIGEAWHAFRVMKTNDAIGIPFDQTMEMITQGFDDDTPSELISNPTMRKNPHDDDGDDELDAARDKYEEFHRYAPKKVGAFPASFKIPKRMRLAGKAKWVTYRSGKVDPATLKKPRKPVDYIHEHDAGVMTYIKDDEPDTDVPEKFRDVGALVLLGQCLGFCVKDADGEEVEAEGKAPLPELYTTPDGKCLFVIQDKRDVLAMSWGGGLGVFARGIDG